jgi:23S rRNA (cytosine1962-C5)-methyltransferase
MDPPNFGHGPKGELWKIEEKFLPLLDACKKILTPNPLFIIINGYAAGYSALAYHNALKDLMKDYQGFVEVGELAIRESASGKLLPSGIFARWSK